MKKTILLPFLSVLGLGLMGGVESAMAAKFTAGDNNKCFVDDRGWDEYYYCGSQQDIGCAGSKKNGNTNRISYYFYHGSSLDANAGQGKDVGNVAGWNGPYWCCNPNKGTAGYFIKKSGDFQTSFTKRETRTKNVKGGTCNYTVVIDACGIETAGDCDTPDNCPTGRTLRNGECVAQCPDGQAFESASSNKCIESQTTSTGGTQTVEAGDTDLINAGANIGDKVNRQCDAVTQLWDPYEEKCVSRKDEKKVKHVSANAMERCYACTSNDNFRTCIDCAPNCDNSIKRSCLLK